MNNNVLVLVLRARNVFFTRMFCTHENCELQTNRVLPTHAALIYARWIIAVISFILCCLSPLNNLPGGSKPYAAERCQVVEVTTPADAKKCCGCCSRKRNDSDRAAAYKDSNPVVGALNEPPLAGPKKVKTMKIRAPCPEEFVSHASYLSYMWLLPYVLPRVIIATLNSLL